jgi:hypothetical protein
MIKLFFIENIKAIKTGFKWMSLIFTSLVLIIFFIAFINNQKPDLELFIIMILSSGIGFPIFGTAVGFLRWWWDYSVIRRNFQSFPFNKLQEIGFKEEVLNKNSKGKFTKLFYTGMIDKFIVDCSIETQNYSKFLIFKFYINVNQITNNDYKRINTLITKENGLLDFNWIGKKYHYKKHGIKSISELQNELEKFSRLILEENFEPFKIAE